MCLAVPGRIIEVRGDMVVVDFQGNRTEASRIMTPDAGMDEWVLVHAGFAITQIDESDARQTWDYLNEMADAEPRESLGEEIVGHES